MARVRRGSLAGGGRSRGGGSMRCDAMPTELGGVVELVMGSFSGGSRGVDRNAAKPRGARTGYVPRGLDPELPRRKKYSTKGHTGREMRDATDATGGYSGQWRGGLKVPKSVVLFWFSRRQFVFYVGRRSRAVVLVSWDP